MPTPLAVIDAAAALAAELLDGVGSRLDHSIAVAHRAEQLTANWVQDQREQVIAASYLHDIGYSPKCRRTGWHPYDGARWLAKHDHDSALCRLVMWHTAAWHEGRLRGLLDDAVAQFGQPNPESIGSAILAAADLSTGPAGQLMTIDERLADIKRRYSSTSVVARALAEGEVEMRYLVKRAYSMPNPGKA